MAGRSFRIWLGLAPTVLLVAIACESVGGADRTLLLCESALERRLAVENDQARILSFPNPLPLSWLAAIDDGSGDAYVEEWERLAAIHAEAEQDIGTYCMS